MQFNNTNIPARPYAPTDYNKQPSGENIFGYGYQRTAGQTAPQTPAQGYNANFMAGAMTGMPPAGGPGHTTTTSYLGPQDTQAYNQQLLAWVRGGAQGPMPAHPAGQAAPVGYGAVPNPQTAVPQVPGNVSYQPMPSTSWVNPQHYSDANTSDRRGGGPALDANGLPYAFLTHPGQQQTYDQFAPQAAPQRPRYGY